MKKRNFNEREKMKKSSIAISQIIILIASIVAFSYFVGQEFRIVSATNPSCCVGGATSCCPNFADGKCPGGEAGYVTCAPNEDKGGKTSDPKTDAEAIALGFASLEAWKKANEFFTKIKGVRKAIIKHVSPESVKARTLTASGKIAWFAETLAIAAGIYVGVRALGQVAGLSPENSRALAAGAAAVYLASQIGAYGAAHSIGVLAWLGPWAWAVGLGVLLASLAFSDQHKQKLISFSCEPWTAPEASGNDCEKCNHQETPCTEYMCKSLGIQCDLLNKENKGEEICVYNNDINPNPPIIRPWLETLTSGYKYSNELPTPQSMRTDIIPEGTTSGCIKPFTPLRFGVTLDQPGKCKIDTEDVASFSAMKIPLSHGVYRYNHSFQMSIPSNDSLSAENISLTNGGVFTIFTRCKNVVGKENLASYVFRFCVDQGPDKTPLKIVETSIPSGAPVSFGKSSVDLTIDLNKPAECRWSHLDKTYDDMVSDTQMNCATRVLDMNPKMRYSCSTTLTGIKDRQDNDFYFKCLDQPHLKNTNRSLERNEGPVPSYKFTLRGTDALVITSAGPNNTVIKDSISSIRVNLTAKTSAGFKDGEAVCSYENVADGYGFIEFAKTGSNEHSQDVYLGAGSYTFNIECIDLGNNVDNTQISLKVEIDNEAPSVVRVFRQENSLKVITNEEARCVYGNTNCDYQFKDGINMSKAVNGTQHSVTWNTNKIFYIKCSDKYGNQLPNQCNIVARPFDMPSVK